MAEYLCTTEVLAHIGKQMGVKDLILSVEYPPTDEQYADTMAALIAALDGSTNDSQR